MPDRLTWKIVGNFSVAIGTPHSVFEIHLHLVWVTKYRKPLLVGLTGHRVRDLIREICGGLDVHILKVHVSKDHVHLLVSIPPQVTISRLVQRLKGKTAYKMLQEFAPLWKQFWGQHLSARVLLQQQRERDGRGRGRVHSESREAGAWGFPRRRRGTLARLRRVDLVPSFARNGT